MANDRGRENGNGGDAGKAGLTDFAKRIVLTGLGAVSMGDRLPKEAVSFLLDQAEKRKDDLFERLAAEMSRFLQKLDIAKEIRNILEDLDVDVHATLRFSRRAGKGKSPQRKYSSASK